MKNKILNLTAVLVITCGILSFYYNIREFLEAKEASINAGSVVNWTNSSNIVLFVGFVCYLLLLVTGMGILFKKKWARILFNVSSGVLLIVYVYRILLSLFPDFVINTTALFNKDYFVLYSYPLHWPDFFSILVCIAALIVVNKNPYVNEFK